MATGSLEVKRETCSRVCCCPSPWTHPEAQQSPSSARPGLGASSAAARTGDSTGDPHETSLCTTSPSLLHRVTLLQVRDG